MVSTRGVIAVLALSAALAACSGPAPVPAPSATAPAGSPDPSSAPSLSPSPSHPPESPFFRAETQADVAYQRALAEGRDEDAALIQRIAVQPQAVWLGEWMGSGAASSRARTVAQAADAAGQIPVFVIYAIPGRDCGLHSAGGLPEEQYIDFVEGVATAIDGLGAWVILEPDAVAQLGDCEGQGDRAGLLREAARILDEREAEVFLDAGNSGWRSPEDTAARLQDIGTEHLAGFSTNVSNYHSTAEEREWGERVSAVVGLPFVTDTSRNGNGSNGEWCNPRGRALGDAPAILGEQGMIATLWIKSPGESDGACNGGPSAGQWWEEVALELARNA
jgi:endoglucanase